MERESLRDRFYEVLNPDEISKAKLTSMIWGENPEQRDFLFILNTGTQNYLIEILNKLKFTKIPVEPYLVREMNNSEEDVQVH